MLNNTRFKSLRNVPYGNTPPAAFIVSDAAFYLNLVDRNTSVRNAPTINRTLDRWGNALAISDPRSANYVTSYRYNANNQPIETWRPDANGARNAGPVTSTYHDAMGRQVATRDAKGQVNGTVYNAAGQVVQVRAADGGIVISIYDLLGNQVKAVDAKGSTTLFSYDRIGRLIQTIRPITDRYRANDAIALWIRTSS